MEGHTVIGNPFGGYIFIWRTAWEGRHVRPKDMVKEKCNIVDTRTNSSGEKCQPQPGALVDEVTQPTRALPQKPQGNHHML